MNNGLITRADDFGSAMAANSAILEAVASGQLIRNVSCMAVGKYIAEELEELASYADRIDLGLHFTLNSEWDSIKWTPCCSPDRIPSLLDAEGNFHQTGEALGAAAPDLEQVMAELNAQLDRLAALGLPISYVDSHMFPERHIPGLERELRLWAKSKGLLYVNGYYKFLCGRPEFAPTVDEFKHNTDKWLAGLPEGCQCLYFMHPAKRSGETMDFANSSFPPGAVAHERELEYRSATSNIWAHKLSEFGLRLLRYRDAEPPEEP